MIEIRQRQRVVTTKLLIGCAQHHDRRRDALPTIESWTWSLRAFLDKRLVELTALSTVDLDPALFTVVLQTSDIGAEKWCELASAARALTLIAHLIIQHVWLDLNLIKQKLSGVRQYEHPMQPEIP